MFLDLNSALLEVKINCDIDFEDSSRDSLLSQFLEFSKASNEAGTIFYRPYIVAYKYLSFTRLRDGIIKANGTDTVEWEAIEEKLKGLLSMQQTLDIGLIDIPKGWESINTNTHKFSITIV